MKRPETDSEVTTHKHLHSLCSVILLLYHSKLSLISSSNIKRISKRKTKAKIRSLPSRAYGFFCLFQDLLSQYLEFRIKDLDVPGTQSGIISKFHLLRTGQMVAEIGVQCYSGKRLERKRKKPDYPVLPLSPTNTHYRISKLSRGKNLPFLIAHITQMKSSYLPILKTCFSMVKKRSKQFKPS